MGKIYYLMGKSASGKDTVYGKLLEDSNLKLNKLVLYTTRPQREGEMEGREYHFITPEKLSDYEKAGKIIEVRHYDTAYGIWSYATIDDGEFDFTEKNYLAIGTLESYTGVRKYFGADNVEPLYIEVEDGLRLERALAREKRQKNPGYKELCRRFIADCEDFSEEKLAMAGIEKRFDNTELEVCLNELKMHISKGLC